MVTALVARVKITLRRASWKQVLTGHQENDSLLADFCARAFHHLCRQKEKNSVVKQTHCLEDIFLREEKHQPHKLEVGIVFSTFQEPA